MKKNSKDLYKFEKAKKKVIRLKQLYEHAIMFVIISSSIAVLNLYQNEWKNPWFLWAVISWLIGLGFHALFVFDLLPFFGKKWEQKIIQEFMTSKEPKDLWE